MQIIIDESKIIGRAFVAEDPEIEVLTFESCDDVKINHAWKELTSKIGVVLICKNCGCIKEAN